MTASHDYEVITSVRTSIFKGTMRLSSMEAYTKVFHSIHDDITGASELYTLDISELEHLNSAEIGRAHV